MNNFKQPAILLLDDGTFFQGTAFGAIGTASGEICFNTGMTGYQEVFTDPSYYGQILIMNNVHIGNYGVKSDEVESGSVKIRGLIARNLEETYSRKQAESSLEDYLIKNKIVCIEGVDTRSLVTHIRKQGAMNCIISSEILEVAALQKELAKVPSMTGLELASHVTVKKEVEIGDPSSATRVAVLDFGCKKNILDCIINRGAFVKIFPATTPFEKIQQFKPNGYFLSNGPGDPSVMGYAIETIKQILKQNKPVFGICLGHQLLALANGVSTYKLHHGHRGLNHPVKNMATGKCEITTQNHGFGVDYESVSKASNIEVTHVNLNDQSVEGIRLKDKPAFSVQYHPESTPGPQDSHYLFDEFIDLIRSKN